MKLSNFGEKLTNKSGILELMDDLGNALQKGGMYMLGGGNPAHIPQMDIIWKKRMQELIENGSEFEKTIGDYTTPQGDADFVQTIAKYFKDSHGFNINSKNICVLNGSQTTFFFLFNMLAGTHKDGSFKKIMFPLVPEYIGYTDQGILDNMFTANEPIIKYIDDHTFKYYIDFDRLNLTSDISAMCVSRPTNPTGNVLTDEEIQKLSVLADKNNIPLIIDNAYGAPFPNILFTKTTPFWNEQSSSANKNIIYVISLSKIGLPSTRTSVVIADEEVIKALTAINAIVSLSTSTLGQRLILPFLKDGSINKICKEIVTPFYANRARKAVNFFHSQMDSKIPYLIHKTEGALFMWVWFKNLPITSYALYQKLKEQKVLVVPGEYFFPGMKNELTYKNECLRITYSQNWETVKTGLEIITKAVKEVYEKS